MLDYPVQMRKVLSGLASFGQSTDILQNMGIGGDLKRLGSAPEKWWNPDSEFGNLELDVLESFAYDWDCFIDIHNQNNALKRFQGVPVASDVPDLEVLDWQVLPYYWDKKNFPFRVRDDEDGEEEEEEESEYEYEENTDCEESEDNEEMKRTKRVEEMRKISTRRD